MDINTKRDKINLLELDLKGIREFMKELGEKPFRGEQVFRWIYKGAESFDDMTNLSKAFRAALDECAEIRLPQKVRVQVSKRDGTRKYLFSLQDNCAIETVFMKYEFGNTVCVSSQAGCRMGCAFCASGMNGLSRNLTPGEILGQVLAAEKDGGEKAGNIVVMGTGEPFDNYDSLREFLYLIHEEKGMNIGWRSITVSTCGILPAMEMFAEEFPQVNLAVSLHASNDELRSKLMPINRKWSMDQLLGACRKYTKKTGRRITFEYALIDGINDGVHHAKELAGRLAGMLCHVNLIPLNRVAEKDMKGADRKRAEEFRRILEGKGVTATVRRELGADIDAACGQLRLKL